MKNNGRLLMLIGALLDSPNAEQIKKIEREIQRIFAVKQPVYEI